jgi:dienelactone hydrolase
MFSVKLKSILSRSRNPVRAAVELRRGGRQCNCHPNFRELLILLSALLLSACLSPASPNAPTFTPTTQPPGTNHPATPPAGANHPTTQPASANHPTTQPPTPTPTLTLTATSTPGPYAAYTIAHLTSRTYGGGELQIVETFAVGQTFTRYIISYPSDGLTIYGFMNVPHADGPFPVVIALHGYIDPAVYGTLDYITRYADSLAGAGYLVLHPNLRGYPPSDDGDNLFRVGMAIDVLNLIALVKAQGGQPGPLAAANPELIGLWGHSMGGGISLRVLTASPEVKAAVLYGAMSGDEQKNYERIYSVFSNGARGLEELNAPAEAFAEISPIFFLDRVTAAVSIHHGEADDVVPLEWSLDLCDRLTALNKPVECFTYPGQPHTFVGEGDTLFVERVVEFFDKRLK